MGECCDQCGDGDRLLVEKQLFIRANADEHVALHGGSLSPDPGNWQIEERPYSGRRQRHDCPNPKKHYYPDAEHGDHERLPDLLDVATPVSGRMFRDHYAIVR